MTPEQELAEMREQYEHATLEAHMLVKGMLYRRCNICKVRPVPHNALVFIWCDPCLDEFLQKQESLEEFVARKRTKNE
jgi:hypothetical protein